MFRFIMIKLIRIYQLTISPFLGQNCRFDPTCSQYALEAFKQMNFFAACFYSIKRVLKCHPFHPGGHDPLPSKADHDQSSNKDSLNG